MTLLLQQLVSELRLASVAVVSWLVDEPTLERDNSLQTRLVIALDGGGELHMDMN